MRPLVTWLIPLLSWSVVLWRARSALTGGANRSLWGAFAAISVGVSLRPAAVETALADLTGIRDVTLLLKHLAGVLAGYFLLEYVEAVRGRYQQAGAARTRLLFATASALALCLLFFLALPHDYDGAFGIDAHYGDPGVQFYLGVFNTVFAVATARAAVLFWSNRASVPPGSPRAGVTCLALASTAGLAYMLYRVYFVLSSGDATRLDADGKPIALTDPVCELLPAAMIVLFVLGVAIAPAHVLAGYVRDQYALWRLHPLWSDVTAAVPQVVLGTPSGPLRDLLTPGDRSLDLTHRAFALRDATLILQEDPPGTGPCTAADPNPDTGTDEDLPGAEARWLHTALRHRAQDLPAPTPPAALGSGTGGRSPREEIAWILTVADAYRRLKKTDRRTAQPTRKEP
ncbi:MAB_1171c family putative transporter [Streptomyces sp. NRRL WC-3742]|uniref:MAB_1171c family putative transporter n=1 Tax=Streptomyces sp. NRRL WC-3742 TaxID=1463934 RepID=UPI0004C6B70A|nr:MAB_1171c family putative transporter [Streptomyces sp. NRRL WC-3742]